MIYCPKCGTANRRGSRFCNECGEPLPMRTALRCPMCGTMNPVGNVYCDRCNARLIPMAVLPSEGVEPEQVPIKGLSLPTIPLEGESEQQVEDVTEEVGTREGAESWLARLRASAVEEQRQAEDVTEEVGAGEEAESWLARLRASAVEEQRQAEDVTEEVGTGEEADWLAQLRASAVEDAEGSEVMAEPIEPVEIPDWLRDLGPIGVEAEAIPGEQQPVAEAHLEEETPTMAPPIPAEVPDWLLGMAPPEAVVSEVVPPAVEAVPEEPALEPPALAPAEVPDWLLGMAPPEAAVPEVVPPAVEAVPEEPALELPVLAPAEVPDWLLEMAPPEAAVSEVVPPAVEAVPEEPALEPPAPAPAEIPDWLREIAPPEAAAPDAAPLLHPPFVGVPVPDVPETSEWLREAALGEVVAPEAEAVEVPEWLSKLQEKPAPPSALPVPVFEGATLSLPPEPGIGAAEAEGLARAEIPDWLEALRPHLGMDEAAAEEEPLETEGLLEGLRGVLPPAIEVPSVRESALPVEVSEASLSRAQLLQSLLTRPAEAPRPEVRRQGISIGELVQRWLVAVVLFVAVGGMLMAPLVVPDVPTLARPARSPGVENLYAVIQSVSADDTVLVAFEYGPPEADELDLVAEPILRHLLAQGAHISVVSTQSEGLAVAAGLLDTIAPAGGELSQQYALLGYRAGGTTGVSQMLTDVGIRPGLVLVLAARPAALRWWVEQTHTLYGDMLPIVAGVSAAIEPAASPYLDASAGQLEGAINGLSGAAAYETLRGLGGRATQRINALAAGHVAIVGLMVIGAVFYALGGSRGRRG